MNCCMQCISDSPLSLITIESLRCYCCKKSSLITQHWYLSLWIPFPNESKGAQLHNPSSLNCKFHFWHDSVVASTTPSEMMDLISSIAVGYGMRVWSANQTNCLIKQQIMSVILLIDALLDRAQSAWWEQMRSHRKRNVSIFYINLFFKNNFDLASNKL